jgi:hypothetical protein
MTGGSNHAIAPIGFESELRPVARALRSNEAIVRQQ